MGWTEGARPGGRRQRPRITANAARLLLAVTLATLAACASTVTATDPLPSWNQGEARQRIESFVRRVSNAGGPGYVPPGERVAVFDNDGTLLVEKPLPVQLAFGVELMRERAERQPALRDRMPYKAAWEGDLVALKKASYATLHQALLDTEAGMDLREFRERAEAFLTDSRHPELQRPWTALVYQPMRELVDYLRAHDFSIFLVSGGGTDFIRGYALETYGVSPARVIGTTVGYRPEMAGPVMQIIRKPAIQQPLNLGPGKVVNLRRHIGQRPILAVGNSDGDLEMLLYVRDPRRPSMGVLLRHDDADRAYAYDSRAQRIQARAPAEDWVMVSMKRDFKTVFATP